MDFFTLTATRRSLRRFTDQQVDKQTIEQILAAAAQAPSSRNSHSSRFMVITDRALIRHMAFMRHYGAGFLEGAPSVIVVMGNREATDLWEDNAAISATYIQLAAQALGLGSCWVHINGRLRIEGQPEQGTAEEYIRTFLPIPDHCGVLCAIALGYSPYPAGQHKTDEQVEAIWL